MLFCIIIGKKVCLRLQTMKTPDEHWLNRVNMVSLQSLRNGLKSYF